MTQKELKKILRYNKRTGVFTWLKCARYGYTNKPAGCVNDMGEVVIRINGKPYKAHRLAYLYVKGYVPKRVIHRNRIKSDNRWINLMEKKHENNRSRTEQRRVVQN